MQHNLNLHNLLNTVRTNLKAPVKHENLLNRFESFLANTDELLTETRYTSGTAVLSLTLMTITQIKAYFWIKPQPFLPKHEAQQHTEGLKLMLAAGKQTAWKPNGKISTCLCAGVILKLYQNICFAYTNIFHALTFG